MYAPVVLAVMLNRTLDRMVIDFWVGLFVDTDWDTQSVPRRFSMLAFSRDNCFGPSVRERVRCAVVQALLVGVFVTFASIYVCAQIDTATLTGRVTDSTDAVVQGASVTVTNIASGAKREAQTNVDGSFSVPLLRPGVYDINVSKEGFSTVRQPSVELFVGQTASVNFTLRVGSRAETVEVTGAAPILETNSAGLGTVIAPREIVDLPLNGRQFTQLLQLSAGTVPIDVSQNVGASPGLGSGAVIPSINGQTNRSNLFYIDGVYATNPYFSGFSLSPSIDAIQEFKEQTHTDQAEFGGSTGGTINVATKSGSDQFHGSAYEFFRNDILDAQNYFAVKKGAYKQNQFGGTFGGPIVHNKLFFFGFYDGYRSVLAANNFAIVPTAAELGGDFRALSTPIYDPTTYNPTTGTIKQFDYNGTPNVIPPSELNQGVLDVVKAYVPAPNYSAAGSAYNYLNNQSGQVTQNQWGIRGDYNIGPRDSLFGRVTISNANHFEPTALPDNPWNTGFNGKNAGVNWVHTFSPTLIAQFTVGYNYINVPGVYVQAGAAALFQTAGFAQGFTPNPGGIRVAAVPEINVPGYFNAQSGWGVGPQDISQYGGSVSKQSGKHDLKFGATLYQTWMYDNWSNDGVTFNQQATWDPTTQSGGNALASMVLGLPNSASRQVGNSGVSLRLNVFSAFAEDSWKVTPKLTMNYGLRWDYTSPVRELRNRFVWFDVGTADWVIAHGDVDRPWGSLPAGVVDSSRSTVTTPNYRNFSPRLSFAYQLAPKTVLRVGGGMVYDNWAGGLQSAQNARGSWPSGGSQNPYDLNTAGVTPGVTAQNPFGSSLPVLPTSPFPNGGGFFQDPTWKNPYSMQWNLEIQQQLGKSETFSLGYVGSGTARNSVSMPFNLAQPGPAPVTGRQPYPNYGIFGVVQSIGHAHYESMQAKFDKRYSNGLSFLTSFTWSRDFDTACADFWEACNFQNTYNLNAERGPSPLDVPLVFTFGSVYELPFGRGKTYLRSGGAAGALLGNWQVNGIFSARSGTPFTPNINFDNANVGYPVGQRPDVVGDPHLSNPSISEWFNTAAYKVAPAYTFGDAGRDSLRGPRYVNLDLSVFRNFQLFEKANLQFRAEFFNSLNHPNFANPDATLEDASVGSISSIVGSPRNIQFALKFSF